MTLIQPGPRDASVGFTERQVAAVELDLHRHLFRSDRVIPPKPLRDGIAALQHDQCFCCGGARGATPQADHLIPRIRCGHREPGAGRPAVLAGSAKWVKHPDVLAILQELPTITGAELGRRLGVSARQGQRIMAAMAAGE